MGTSTQISLRSIFAVFFRIGLLSFGGGLAGWVYREVLISKRWLSDDAFLTGLALGQVLPGANIANLAVYTGQHLRGAPGAATALLALLAGPFLGVIFFLNAYGWLRTIPWMTAVLDGVAAAAVGLLVLVTVRKVRHASQGLVSILVILATFLAIAILRLPLVPVALGAGAFSVAAAWGRGKHGA